MPASQTTRLQVYVWPSEDDVFNRGQMHTSHTALEDRAAVFLKGTLAARDLLDAADHDRSFFLVTDENPTDGGILYYCDGSEWHAVNAFATPESTLTPGDSNAQGSDTTYARSDHSHAMLPWRSSTPLATGTSGNAGADNSYARGDHRHSIGAGSVVAGSLGPGAVNSASVFASGVVSTTALADGAATRLKIAASERIPVGTVLPFASNTVPAGWLECNGAAVSRTSYADLFAAIGTAFGGGNGSTTFNLPNMAGRLPRGAAISPDARGATGGAETVTLVTANLPAHTHGSGSFETGAWNTRPQPIQITGEIGMSAALNHTHPMDHNHEAFEISGGTHVHLIANDAAASGSLTALQRAFSADKAAQGTHMANSGTHDHTVNVPNYEGNTANPNGNLSHTHSLSLTVDFDPGRFLIQGTSGSTGSGTPVDILDPYLTLNYIIKY